MACQLVVDAGSSSVRATLVRRISLDARYETLGSCAAAVDIHDGCLDVVFPSALAQAVDGLSAAV